MSAPPITLTARDLQRMREVQETLLSPLEFSDPDAWRSEVNGRVRALTGADKAVFFVPALGAWSDELDPCAHVEYQAHFHTLDRGAELSLARGLRVASHSQLYDIGEFLRSEWHNDFLARHRCFRTLGLTVRLTCGEPPWSFLALQRERPDAGPFDSSVRAHLELVAPALRVGVETVLRSHTWRAALDGALDRVDEAMAVYDGDRLLHRNTSMEETLAEEPERRRIEEVMRKVARAAASPRVGTSSRRTVRTDRGPYEVRAFRTARGFDGPVVVVALERGFRCPLGIEELVRTYALTPREIEVARLIAGGETNDAIADGLGISPHTARRHTESVMRKLDVASRRQVVDRITR